MNELVLYVLVALGFVVVAVWASNCIIWEFDRREKLEDEAWERKG